MNTLHRSQRHAKGRCARGKQPSAGVAFHHGDAHAALLAELSGTSIPQPIQALRGKPVRFENRCAADKMADFVLERVGV